MLHYDRGMATLQVISPIGVVRKMAISKPVFAYKPFGKPLAEVAAELPRGCMKFECTVEYTKEGWELIQKACARNVTIRLPGKFPGIRKGETVTLHLSDGFNDRDVTGVLYHVRKPYRDSEDRIYYIRETLFPPSA